MYRKFTADYIFTGDTLLSGSKVLITDGAGVIIDCIERKDAGEDIEIFQGLLSPGFINTHCHLELSHLKGKVPEKTGLVSFVQQIMGNRAAGKEEIAEAMLNAENEMYTAGIVAVGDICNTPDTIPIKQKSKLLWHNFIEVSGFTDKYASQRMESIKKVYQQFSLAGLNRHLSLSPHAPYSVSKSLFQLLNTETRGKSLLFTTRNARQRIFYTERVVATFWNYTRHLGSITVHLESPEPRVSRVGCLILPNPNP